MIQLGKIQTLSVVKTTEFGVYLNESNGSMSSKILLPKRQVPPDLHLDDQIEVFVYKDSEDRFIATTITPFLQLGEISLLKVVQVTTIGAFLDWGLTKDLLLPFKEQTYEVQEGDSVLVSLYIDKSKRLCATMKVYEQLATASPYKKNDPVTGIVYEILPTFGAFVAVDYQYSALIPNQELTMKLSIGTIINARVAEVREDGKLTLSLREKSYIQMNSDSQLIYNKLVEQNGFLPYHDKSNADSIKKEFNLSKNAFKRAVGRLLKEKKIKLTEKGIYLSE